MPGAERGEGLRGASRLRVCPRAPAPRGPDPARPPACWPPLQSLAADRRLRPGGRAAMGRLPGRVAALLLGLLVEVGPGRAGRG